MPYATAPVRVRVSYPSLPTTCRAPRELNVIADVFLIRAATLITTLIHHGLSAPCSPTMMLTVVVTQPEVTKTTQHRHPDNFEKIANDGDQGEQVIVHTNLVVDLLLLLIKVTHE